MGGRQPLHLPGLPRIHAERFRRRRNAVGGTGHRPGPAARQPSQRTGASGQDPGPQADGAPRAADPDQDRGARQRAPSDLHGLHRRAALRRRRPRRGRVPLHRPVHHRSLQPPSVGNSGGAPQLRKSDGRFRPEPGRPQRQGPAPDPGDPAARRAVPGHAGPVAADQRQRAQPAGTLPPETVHPQGSVRPLLLGADLPAEGPFQHRNPHPHRGHADGRAGRRAH